MSLNKARARPRYWIKWRPLPSVAVRSYRKTFSAVHDICSRIPPRVEQLHRARARRAGAIGPILHGGCQRPTRAPRSVWITGNMKSSRKLAGLFLTSAWPFRRLCRRFLALLACNGSSILRCPWMRFRPFFGGVDAVFSCAMLRRSASMRFTTFCGRGGRVRATPAGRPVSS